MVILRMAMVLVFNYMMQSPEERQRKEKKVARKAQKRKAERKAEPRREEDDGEAGRGGVAQAQEGEEEDRGSSKKS